MGRRKKQEPVPFGSAGALRGLQAQATKSVRVLEGVDVDAAHGLRYSCARSSLGSPVVEAGSIPVCRLLLCPPRAPVAFRCRGQRTWVDAGRRGSAVGSVAVSRCCRAPRRRVLPTMATVRPSRSGTSSDMRCRRAAAGRPRARRRVAPPAAHRSPSVPQPHPSACNAHPFRPSLDLKARGSSRSIGILRAVRATAPVSTDAIVAGWADVFGRLLAGLEKLQ